MKRKFLGILAMSMFAAFTSCEKDAPEINFSQTTTIELDVKEIIDALNDMSMTLTEKLDILNKALTDSNSSLSKKLDILKAAIETQTLDLNTKLSAIETAVDQGLLDVKSEITATKNALIASLDEKFADTQESLDAVNKALSKIIVDANIYEYDKAQKQLIMSNSAWEVLNTDEALAAVFMGFLPTTTYSFRIIQNNAEYSVTFTEAPDKASLRLLRQRNLVWYDVNNKTVVPEADVEGKDYDREILVPAVGVIETHNKVVYTCTLARTDGGDLNGATFGTFNRWFYGGVYQGPFYDLNRKTEGNVTMTYANGLNVIQYLPQITLNISVPENI